MTGWRILHVLDHGLPARDGYVTRTMGLAAAQRGFGWDPVLFTGPRQGPVAATMERAEGWVLHRTPPPKWTCRRRRRTRDRRQAL